MSGAIPSRSFAALVLSAVFLSGALLEAPGCSTSQVEAGGTGALCEFDEQCGTGLLCRCIRRRNPDDEGPDEVIAPGVCQTTDYVCPTDAGPSDAGPTDTATDTPVDVTSDAPTDTATDAPTDTATDAAPDALGDATDALGDVTDASDG